MRLPPAAPFILGGIALALIPGVPDITLDRDLALWLFLPPLLLSCAFFTVLRNFRANWRIILQAVGAVAFTTLGVGSLRILSHRCHRQPVSRWGDRVATGWAWLAVLVAALHGFDP
jgi:hypothetical protein